MDKSIYRAKDPAPIIAAHDATQVAYKAWQEATAEWIRSIDDHDRKLWESRGALGPTHRIIGLEWRRDWPTPAGWRRERNQDYMVPSLKTVAGKAARHQLAQHQPPRDMRKDVAGMPASIMSGGDDSSPGVYIHTWALHIIRGQAYAEWNFDVSSYEDTDSPELEEIVGVHHKRDDAIDLELWDRVKLSEWYTILENRLPETIELTESDIAELPPGPRTTAAIRRTIDANLGDI